MYAENIAMKDLRVLALIGKARALEKPELSTPEKLCLILQSSNETNIWFGTRSNLSANLPVDISGLCSTVKMIIVVQSIYGLTSN